jgi:hypothetical protein
MSRLLHYAHTVQLLRATSQISKCRKSRPPTKRKSHRISQIYVKLKTTRPERFGTRLPLSSTPTTLFGLAKSPAFEINT